MRKFTKKEINSKLKTVGWRLAPKVQYRGMLEVHKVTCTNCETTAFKRLDNLLYREEHCDSCFKPVKKGFRPNTPPKKKAVNSVEISSTDSRLDTVIVKLDKITDLLTKLIKNNVKPEPVQKQPLKGTSGIKSIFVSYIVKAGFKKYGRKMQSDEWFKLSHELSEQLIKSVAWDAEEEKKLTQQYVDILTAHPTKQGQDILPAVIPVSQHKELSDKIKVRLVKL